jgi:gamma-glutamyltranspeptidase/glutathione hydrolase
MLMPLRARVLTAAVAAAALLLGPATASLPASAVVRARASSQLPKRPVAAGTGGAVASDDVEATSAGLEVLRDGGNAIDAAVAAAAVLGVTDPFAGGIGGGGYLVYYDARTRRVSTIDGRETAPRLAAPGLFTDPGTGQPLAFPAAVTSGLSVGVPGTLMTWQKALDLWGTQSLAQLLRPAELVARQGFPVDAAFRGQVRQNAARFAEFSSTSELFLPGGQLPVIGSTFRNPQLAATYAEIGRRGVAGFYGGPLGGDIVKAVENLPLAPGATLTPRPGLLCIGDLHDYAALVQAPTHVSYRGYDVYGMAPSSSGGIAIGEALTILSNFDLAAMAPVQALHHYLEATRLAFADRNRYIDDNARVQVPLEQLLSTGFGRQRARLIDPARALISPVAPGDPLAGSRGCASAAPAVALRPGEGTSTNHLVVADRLGNVVSYTTTIEQLGGSGIVVPGRGFLLNSELADCDYTALRQGVPDPDLPATGRRRRSGMSPTIVLRSGRPWLAAGSPGGPSIISIVLQILLNRIDFGMTLPQAIAAPRASQRNAAVTQAEPEFIAAPTTPGLDWLGHSFAIADTSPLDPAIKISPDMGAATGLEFLGDGRVLAAAEPVRRGGGSAGVLRPSG